jgi:hypothetical protein
MEKIKITLEELQAQNLRIVRSDFGQICSYCGWETEPSGTSWHALQEHIQHCKKHPVYQLKKENGKLRNAVNNLLILLEDYSGTNADMKIIEKASKLLDEV